jgi:hypothetical protein
MSLIGDICSLVNDPCHVNKKISGKKGGSRQLQAAVRKFFSMPPSMHYESSLSKASPMPHRFFT